MIRAKPQCFAGLPRFTSIAESAWSLAVVVPDETRRRPATPGQSILPVISPAGKKTSIHEQAPTPNLEDQGLRDAFKMIRQRTEDILTEKNNGEALRNAEAFRRKMKW